MAPVPIITASSFSMRLEKRSLTSLADGLEPYVLTGLWERYDESPHQSLKWTLKNFSALLVVACLTPLIALAQSQCWCLLRYVIAQYNKSLRLPDDSTPDPLLELSQGQVIISALPVLSRWASRLFDKICRPFRAESRHTRDTREQDDPVESPYFGIASILNISFFLVMGVAIPWWLTEGALGTPIVKSRNTEECLKSNATFHFVDTVERLPRADEIFHLCQDRLNAGCDSAYYLSDPQITKIRSTACPFKANICFNNTGSFEITQWNISAFQMGVNSKSKLSFNHRLTCAPVSLDPFLWPYQNRSIVYVPKVEGYALHVFWPNVSLKLSTKNGPNKLSFENSGRRMVEEDGPRDLSILPENLGRVELSDSLKRDDGESFLVVYRAGRRFFPTMIHDPFFAAHRQDSFPFTVFPDRMAFYPDHEATALGCVEQFQYCLPLSSPSTPCTDWGTCDEAFSAMHDSLIAQSPSGLNGDISLAFERWNGQFAWSLKEMLALFKYVRLSFPVHRYLVDRAVVLRMLPLIQWGKSLQSYESFEVGREPWVAEVETWFMKAFLSGILRIQSGALFTILDIDSNFSSEYIREWKLCGRILFHNGDYTNINWIGFWAIAASFTFICLIGNQVQTIHKGLKDSLMFLFRRVKVVISRLQKLLGTIRNLRRPTTWLSKPVTIWSVFLFFQSLSRRQPWYGSGSGVNESSDGAEMDDLEEPSATPSQVNSGDTEEYEDIDNPI